MGQGYSMATLSAASATIDVPELSDMTQDKVLASSRFMKSIRARNQNGFIFVKALMKPYSAFDVRGYVKRLIDERNIIAAIPNALGYQRIVEVATGGFLVRQYMFSSVYDRLSTRPFLEDIEKRWLSYQLLCAVRDCHAQNLHHGDIKTENLLVTSWNWLYLTDFSSSFKPTSLPEDNPADFSFFFDTSSRRVCYIAPERFLSEASQDVADELNWAMDMFSVGCVIAEMFLEGPIFTLSQLFKYRSGDYNPEHAHISKIDDSEVRAMVLNMIELDPEKRYSAEQHLSFYKSKIFPEYFYSFLHDYMKDLTDPASLDTHITLNEDLLLESDRKIDKVYQDYDKISYFLGYPETLITNEKSPSLFSNNKSIPHDPGKHIDNALHDGTLLFLTIVSSAMRNTAKASARLKACDLLASFAQRLPDEAKLDRILPYVVGMLGDKSDAVKFAALHATTSILASIKVVSPINAYLFPEYIVPRLRQFLNTGNGQPSPLVRAAYASCLASIALASGRMLDMMQAVRADGRMPSVSADARAPDSPSHGLYDIARAELVPFFEEATKILITDPDTSVRRALLGSISRLCMFFESTKSSDLILSHLNTYLNETDWILKCAFYDALVGVATYVGISSLEQFIVPIMIGSLTDAEHFVVEKVIRSLARMAALGLFQRSVLWELSGLISRYLVHPSIWIREAAAQFAEQACKFLSTADRYCIVLPILQPFLKAPLLEFSETGILDKLKAPFSRAIFDAAVLWATKRERSLFWTAASQDHNYMIARSDSSFVTSNFTKRFPHRIPPSHKDRDDQQSLETLRNFGLTPDDEVKLMALRQYILKYSQHRLDDDADDRQRMLNNIVSLSQLDITPQNVFFDTVQPYRPARKGKTPSKVADKETSRSIADALLDASVTLDQQRRSDDPPSRDSRDKAQSSNAHASDVEHSPGDSAILSARNGSFDRPNIRIEGLKAEPARRSSSVGGRHALLDADRLSVDRRGSTQVKHKNSHFNLLGRAETIKANPEISTTQENAFGKLDRSPSDMIGVKESSLTRSLSAMEKARSGSPGSQTSGLEGFEANHSYTGKEPTVMRLLDNHLHDNFPVDLFDFGAPRNASQIETPIKSATTPSPPQTATAPASQNGNKHPWQPSGLLLAQLVEHTAAINKVVVAPDHAFFVTASDDGSCKVWDTARLEKNVSARSRYTHQHADGTRVKSLCFIEDTHTFTESNDVTKFSRPVLVRDWQIPQQLDTTSGELDGEVVQKEYAVCMHHFREPNSQSILLIATSLCRILMVDMKNMEIIRSMHNPFQHGTPTTFCIDKKHHWLLLGTSYGILDLWDLRFKLRLRSFGIGGQGAGQRVEKLLLHPSRGHGRWVIASCGGEISIWDIEKLTCREVIRPSSFQDDPSRKVKNHEPWFPDEESSESLLKRFSTRLASDEAVVQPSMTSKDDEKVVTGAGAEETSALESAHSQSITSLAVFTDYIINQAQPENPSKVSLMLSAGQDRTVRYWNLANIDQSTIVSGPVVNVVGEENNTKARYETSWPTSMSLSGLVQLVEEKLSDTSQNDLKDGAGSARNTPRKKRDATARGGKNNGDAATKGSTSGKTPRNAIISAAQEQLLKTHLDDITDVCLLRRPYGCIVSVDRGGAIFVFH
ncbi:Serine/threonine-protein kinase [Lithohypha guttulata]|nr:Serine/threonine-protein kinase [Lithohypha guttulata]